LLLLLAFDLVVVATAVAGFFAIDVVDFFLVEVDDADDAAAKSWISNGPTDEYVLSMLDASTMWIRYSSVEDDRLTPAGQASSPFRRFTFLAMYTVDASLQAGKPKKKKRRHTASADRRGERRTPSPPASEVFF